MAINHKQGRGCPNCGEPFESGNIRYEEYVQVYRVVLGRTHGNTTLRIEGDAKTYEGSERGGKLACRNCQWEWKLPRHVEWV